MAMIAGVVLILLLVLLITYVILQETRAQNHWRTLVRQGNVDAIRQILTTEMEGWRRGRPPKGMPAAVWAGVQGAEIAALGRDWAFLTTSAEGEYRTADGRREETASPLDVGMRVAAKLVEMLFYDVPNVRFWEVRVDVYTTFRDESGQSHQRCILSTTADRDEVEDVDWEALRPHEIIGRFRSRYEVRDGRPVPIEPDPPPVDEPEPSGAEDRRTA
ncbi:MAG TPA: hypothetical protein VIO14_11220 [Dehalococcoidia bacterium]